MAYIGKTPTIGNFQVCDAISVVNNQAAYTMQVGSVNVSPESANHMLVSLNGILQAPTSSFTVSGSTITFASNLVTGDVINFIHILGSVLDLGVPSDGTVTAAKLGANSVTAAKLNNDIISGTTALTSEPADTDEFLVSDAGTLKRIDYSLIKGGGITEADQWRLTTNFNGDASPIASNLERVDTGGQGLLGTGMSESSGIFTFPSTGIWLVKFVHNYFINGDNWYNQARIAVTTNNSSYTTVAQSNNFADNASVSVYISTYCESIIDVQNTTNVKVRFEVSIEDNNATTDGDNNVNKTYFTFIRLGDT